MKDEDYYEMGKASLMGIIQNLKNNEKILSEKIMDLEHEKKHLTDCLVNAENEVIELNGLITQMEDEHKDSISDLMSYRVHYYKNNH